MLDKVQFDHKALFIFNIVFVFAWPGFMLDLIFVLFFFSFLLSYLCFSRQNRIKSSNKENYKPAVMAVHSQSLSGIADVLLQRQRTSSSSSSSSSLGAPTTILELGRLHSGLSEIHLVKLHNTCWHILGRAWVKWFMLFFVCPFVWMCVSTTMCIRKDRWDQLCGSLLPND